METKAQESQQAPEQSSLLDVALLYSSDVAQLLTLELKLTLAHLPRIAALLLGLPVLLLLCWLGLSGSVAGLIYEWSGSIATALLGFAVCQAVAFTICSHSLTRFTKEASFPRSRRCLKALWNNLTGVAEL